VCDIHAYDSFPNNDHWISVCLMMFLTSFHSHGRRELGARDDEHYTDDKPFFPRASDQTHRPSNRRASKPKPDECPWVESRSSGHMQYRNDWCPCAIALSILLPRRALVYYCIFFIIKYVTANSQYSKLN